MEYESVDDFLRALRDDERIDEAAREIAWPRSGVVGALVGFITELRLGDKGRGLDAMLRNVVKTQRRRSDFIWAMYETGILENSEDGKHFIFHGPSRS